MATYWDEKGKPKVKGICLDYKYRFAIELAKHFYSFSSSIDFTCCVIQNISYSRKELI